MTTVKESEVSSEFVAFVSKRTGLTKGTIHEMCKHNVLTINQVASLSKKTVTATQQLIRPRYKGGEYYTVLDAVYPFPEIDENGELKQGRVFIDKNQKFFEFIRRELM